MTTDIKRLIKGNSIPILIVVVGCFLTYFSFLTSSNVQEKVIVDAFLANAKDQIDQVEHTLNQSLNVLHALKAFFDSSDYVSRSEFANFAASMPGIGNTIHALEWIPLVKHFDRRHVEQAARLEGIAEFAFREKAGDEDLVLAGTRAEYFPVYYVEPLTGNETALGFDLGSNSERKKALDAARVSGKLVATAPIKLVQETGDQIGFLVFLATYHKDTLPTPEGAGPATLKGFVLSAFRAGMLIKAAQGSAGIGGAARNAQPQAIQFTVADVTEPERPALLYSVPAYKRASDRLTVTKSIDIAGRHWQITAFAPRGGFYSAQLNKAKDWSALVIGIILTALLAFASRQFTAQRVPSTAISQNQETLSDYTIIPETVPAGNLVYVYPAIATAAAILLVDLNTELGIAIGIAYVIVVWLASLTEKTSYVLIAASVTVLLTVIGFALSPVGGEVWKVVYNRVLSITAISLFAYLVYSRLQTEALRRNEQGRLLATMTENLVDGLVTVDEKGTILSVNRACETIFGYKASEMAGMKVRDLMPEPIRNAHDGYLEAYLKTGVKKIIGTRREVEGCRKDGSVFPLDVSVSESKIGGNRIYLGIMRDISERRSTEKKLLRTMENLQLSNRELEKFAYVASHDLKSPLRGIDNLATWLEEDLSDQLDTKNLERLHLLRGRVSRMERLLDDLLAYSRAGRIVDSTEPTGLADLVHEIVALLDLPDGMIVDVDESLQKIILPRMPIQQVLQNLIGNAVKHHDKQQGRITVSGMDHGDSYSIHVCDDGPGIPEIFHEKIFEMFQTLRSRDEVEGSGMGLALIKKIVFQMGGHVSLQSEEGKGSTFTIVWPKQSEFQTAAE